MAEQTEPISPSPVASLDTHRYRHSGQPLRQIVPPFSAQPFCHSGRGRHSADHPRLGGRALLSTSDPIGRDAKNRLQPPSLNNPMGTDELGRDVLTRVLYGGQISLQVGFVSIVISTVIGVPLGLIAGYFGRQNRRPDHAPDGLDPRLPRLDPDHLAGRAARLQYHQRDLRHRTVSHCRLMPV